ncbi:MAG: aromatic amino acid transport family protein [Candidatus Pacearchaeota archaeon]
MVKTILKFIPALAILIGTIVGAGFLGIPYVVSKSGFIPGLLVILFVFLFILTIKLYLGEIVLRTKGNLQLVGYAEKYTGEIGKFLMFFATIFGIYSALIAYIIAEGESLSYLIFGNFNYSFIFSCFFWLIMCYLTFIGLKALKKYEKISMFLVIILFLIIFINYVKSIKLENLMYVNKENFFLPFGVILFSFLGFSAIPEVNRVMHGKENYIKDVIIIGTLVPFILYSIFSFVLLGNFAENINEIATLSLNRIYSSLAVLTLFTAYFSLSIAIRDMFRFDLKLGRMKGWIFSSFVPFIIFLLFYIFKIDSFIKILGIGGVISGGLTGILILFMNYNAKKNSERKPEYELKINKFIIFLFSLIFLIGTILELLK